jgi:acyl-CoA reductase-like NAD-dependent aldehyde dehydrogenase
MQKASETLIPVTLELGGKDAFIVCEDVDLPNVSLDVLYCYAVHALSSLFSSTILR